MTIRKPGSSDADQWNSSLPQSGRFDDLHMPYDMSGSVIGANGAGVTELIDQDYNNKLDRWEFSGRQDTDAVLIGSRYTITNLTYSFPTSGKFYADQGYPAGAEPAGQIPFNEQMQDAVRYALNLVSSYCNLTFTEIDETKHDHANLRYSQTTYSGVPSAYANFPSSSEQAGDVWFGRTNQPFYLTPQPGNWGQATIMHETGHTLGLKHGHQDYTHVDLTGYIDGNPNGDPRYGSVALERQHDGQDWSLMTYDSDPTVDPNRPSFEGDGFNQPQTYMMDDIAAMQYLYGANYNTQAGNTVYSWDPNTGIEYIDGVAQATPTSNKISMTLWDGNGTDTYDLSNYTTNLKVDLRPGHFSTFSQDQLVNHQAYSGGHAIAVGNVGNALLYQNDTRSLIEDAKGGVGNDHLVGNQVGNMLDGGDGGDKLSGAGGADVLIGGGGSDTLIGGGGSDTFFFASGSGTDAISDLGKGDTIRIDVKGVRSFSDLSVTSDGSGGSLVTWKGGASVDLIGVATTAVKASEFSFGSLPAQAGPAAFAAGPSNGAGAAFSTLHALGSADHASALPHLTGEHLMLA